jgi:protein-ribulosamine 3-kinase
MLLSPPLQEQVLFCLRKKFPELPSLALQPVTGGSINHAYQITSGFLKFFCKINSATKFPQLFDKEVNGLRVLSAYRIRTPEVFFSMEVEGYQVLVMEWMEEGERTKSFWCKLGEDLARLHHVTAPAFGFSEDNYMGSVPQLNPWTKDWFTFFQTQRLEYLVDWCERRQLLTTSDVDLFQNLYSKLSEIFGKEAKPSLQHGDLWAGNFLCNATENPVLIDPAVYYGHPAVDMGMSRLFGGFDPAFYEAYAYHATMPAEEQCQVTNLYPLLIHLLLFGSAYRNQIVTILRRFA